MGYPKGCGEIEAENGVNVVISLEEAYLIPTLFKEVGELASIYAKVIKNKAGDLEDEDREKIKKELGDIIVVLEEFCNLYGWILLHL
jgi:NTP pyrophosphatase (non-canonical NTP hydrolase)